jgi:hypothetical protein
VVALLARRAERLDRALKKIADRGGQVVLLDGTLIRTFRRTWPANRANYSGKHKAHGLLFLALTDDLGNLVWISRAFRGAASKTPPPAARDSWHTYALPGSAPWPTAASSASRPTSTPGGSWPNYAAISPAPPHTSPSHQHVRDRTASLRACRCSSHPLAAMWWARFM